MRSIGPYVCLTCSVINSEGERIYRVFNSLFDLRDHGRMNHDRTVPNHSILNLHYGNHKALLTVTSGTAKMHCLIKKEKYNPELNPKKKVEEKEIYYKKRKSRPRRKTK
jgi:hypothetical protein